MGILSIYISPAAECPHRQHFIPINGAADSVLCGNCSKVLAQPGDRAQRRRGAGMNRHRDRNGRAIAALALAGLFGCARPGPRPPAPTADQQRMTATDYALECMSSAGVGCLTVGPAADGWSALGDLRTALRAPLPLLAEQILAAETRLREGRYTEPRLAALARPVEMWARDLSCRAVAMRTVGAELAALRRRLATTGKWRGLGHTAAGPALDALVAAAAPLDRSYLATAHCTGGKVFALLAPPARAPAADEDPRAYDAGGWQVFAVARSPDALLSGYRAPPTPAAPRVADQPPEFAVDPWLPLTEVDL